MLPRNHPDRIGVSFDDHRLVANAGLLLPATLAHQRPSPRPGLANTQDTDLVVAGGDCIDALRAWDGPHLGRHSRRHPPWAPSCAVFAGATSVNSSRELLAAAWQANPASPLTIETQPCETYGLAKEGARHHGYTGKRGYHPLLAVAAGTGDVLMCRLREGRANTAWRRPLCVPALRRGQRATWPTAAHSPGIVWQRWTCASPSPSASTKACGT